MKSVLLTDGTRIINCSEATTSDSIYIVRDSYEAVGAIRDLFTDNNTNVIIVYDENEQEVNKGIDLILLHGSNIIENEDSIICEVKLRTKTEIEKMQDQITELQEAVIGE